MDHGERRRWSGHGIPRCPRWLMCGARPRGRHPTRWPIGGAEAVLEAHRSEPDGHLGQCLDTDGTEQVPDRLVDVVLDHAGWQPGELRSELLEDRPRRLGRGSLPGVPSAALSQVGAQRRHPRTAGDRTGTAGQRRTGQCWCRHHGGQACGAIGVCGVPTTEPSIPSDIDARAEGPYPVAAPA
jgi:hypothetical protein